jgi:hypothetical protein
MLRYFTMISAPATFSTVPEGRSDWAGSVTMSAAAHRRAAQVIFTETRIGDENLMGYLQITSFTCFYAKAFSLKYQSFYNERMRRKMPV